ncbi:alpha/beta fold hydrolase [candidate division FCPU426 bacterium]|nr:alpha/beta fold hydrolase [candidate division FCPU426 bacterium]
MTGEALGGQSYVLKRGPRALLFLHGFTSTTQALLPIGELLAAAGYTVSMPLLPGHGTTPEDMAAHSCQDWIDFALQAWDQLAAEYDKPAVIGFSMGGALGIHVAVNRPVPALAALAPALFLKDWRLVFLPVIKWLMPWKQSIGNDIKGKAFQEKSYTRWKMKSLEDLLRVMEVARRDVPALRVPLLGIQSAIDHTIPPACLDYLMEHAGSLVKEKHRLQDSYHVLTLDNEYKKVAEWLIDFFSRQGTRPA